MAQLFLPKTSFNFEIWVTFDQGQRMALTFDIHLTSLTHLVETWGCNSFQKIIIFTLSHTKAYVTKFDLGIKWVKVNPGS